MAKYGYCNARDFDQVEAVLKPLINEYSLNQIKPDDLFGIFNLRIFFENISRSNLHVVGNILQNEMGRYQEQSGPSNGGEGFPLRSQ